MKYNYLATLRDGIPYRKDLRKCVGSVTATILMQQLDFHFFKYSDGFYKFLSPTESHPDYREGDSWTEELAFSEKEFRCAFDHIGVRHLSKSAYMQSPNPFINEAGQEMFYCSYHDKQKGLTWYFRNHELVDLLIEKLLAVTPPKERKRPSVVDSTVTNQRSFTVTDQRESTVDDHRESCSLPKGSYVTDQREVTFIYKENNKEDNKKENPPTPSNETFNLEQSGSVSLAPQVESALQQTAITVIEKPGLVQVQNKSALQQTKLKPDGSECFPWELIDPIKGWVIEKGFLSYVADVVKDYPIFKNLPTRRFAREVFNFIDKAHFENERKSKIFGYWQDYLAGDDQDDITISQLTKQVEEQSELERIRNASKRKFEL